MANTGLLRDWLWFWQNGSNYAKQPNTVNKTSRTNLTVLEAKTAYSLNSSLLTGLPNNEMIANDSIEFKYFIADLYGIDVNDCIRHIDYYYVVGSFNMVNGIACNNIVRLNLDFSVDTTFNIGTGTNDIINCIHIGHAYTSIGAKLYIGGWFTKYNGTNVTCIARLNLDGTIDNTLQNGLFDPTSSNDRVIYSIKTDYNDKIVVGGRFLFNTGSYPAALLVRLKYNGTHDALFVGTSNLDYATVRSVSVDTQNTIYAVGERFDVISQYINGNNVILGYTKNILATTDTLLDYTKITKINNNFTGSYDGELCSYYSVLLCGGSNNSNYLIFGGYYKDSSTIRSIYMSCWILRTNSSTNDISSIVDGILYVGTSIPYNSTVSTLNYPKITKIKIFSSNGNADDSLNLLSTGKIFISESYYDNNNFHTLIHILTISQIPASPWTQISNQTSRTVSNYSTFAMAKITMDTSEILIGGFTVNSNDSLLTTLVI